MTSNVRARRRHAGGTLAARWRHAGGTLAASLNDYHN